ncbi:MAG: hydrogenase expression/formation protein HypE [Deltaproteobacteria bacterium]|nr:MAG: hydrogenase expression/formation protein HypE [Deltaproteobacteria bacterium]RLB05674.1 MAG: hydrogenase expression/formation protein HypE [Deltaproteobacteria bacterium]HEC32454.1 hydrogenase expression/formation protein HypE [Deltaproteobacteria bacterium]
MTNDKILLAHGAGGKLSAELIQKIFLPVFDNEILNGLEDSAVFECESGKLDFTTDSFVVKPLFFPGGDIGRLSICGTVNDLSVMGATPLYLSVSFIIEEGFSLNDLEKIAHSMKTTAKEAGISIVAGDTKVVERGAADNLYVTTAGVGKIADGINLSCSNAAPGQVVIINGYIGDHEMAVLLARGEFSLHSEIKSDCAPLNGLVEAILKTSGKVSCMRDPTRGGLATVLNEVAEASGVGIIVDEDLIPVRQEVKSICDLLGFDPLYLANEGKIVVFADENDADIIISAMKKHPLGKNTAIIGRVVEEPKCKVLLETRIKGHRVLGLLSGEQFPRIC